MKRFFTDRSRIEDYQRCKRLRFDRYHEQGIGLEAARKPLPLAVGGSVHKGLEVLTRDGGKMADPMFTPVEGMKIIGVDWSAEAWQDLEERAVAAALADFRQYTAGSLELDTAESKALTQPQADITALQLAASADEYGIDTSGLQESMEQRFAAGRNAFDDYLEKEQSALVEALVRAYARRRLEPLLEQYQVLEVEREGQWLLSKWHKEDEDGFPIHKYKEGKFTDELEDEVELYFMSRPDALILDRTSRELFILSFKTAAHWEDRTERSIQHDMQGLSEGVEIEKRLLDWWGSIDIKRALESEPESRKQFEFWQQETGGDRAMFDYLCSLHSPPRIMGIRYEYMLKGERWLDKELSAATGLTARSQRSHLIRRYVAVSVPQRKSGPSLFEHGDVCWSWDYTRIEDLKESSLAWQNWKSQPVWESMSIKEWIDMLDTAAPLMSGEDTTAGLEPRQLGFQCVAQKLGVTKNDPLEAVFIPPIVVYRQDDELRDWVEQIEAQEVAVVTNADKILRTEDEGERRHLLNVHFPQVRRACEYPTTCSMVRICWGADEIRRDPLGSGQYVRRKVNHPQEMME